VPEAQKQKEAKRRSIRAVEASNFFLADVQTGLGPFLAAYLASNGWNAGDVGVALTLSGLVTVVVQTPAGALVDRVRAKRTILAAGVAVLTCGALLLAWNHDRPFVYTAQVLIGSASPFLAPTLAAITMGLVGQRGFDRQFGKNQSFNAAGNVAAAVGIAAVSRAFGNQAIFILTAALGVPTVLALAAIRGDQIDNDAASGGRAATSASRSESIASLASDRVLVLFLCCVFLFHFANAAMLPQLGEMLAKGSARNAAPFMSACVIVTQLVITGSAGWIGRYANTHGRKLLLLVGFSVLPFRAVFYTMTHWTPALISIQILDGVANAIFTVVSVLVIADRTRGTGRFNLAQGALATAVGIGASLSNTFGGKITQYFGFRISFLALGAVAALAFLLLLLGVPETLPSETETPGTPASRVAPA
jgi:MFS family permease